jgi:hypothetical protein
MESKLGEAGTESNEPKDCVWCRPAKTAFIPCPKCKQKRKEQDKIYKTILIGVGIIFIIMFLMLVSSCMLHKSTAREEAVSQSFRGWGDCRNSGQVPIVVCGTNITPVDYAEYNPTFNWSKET